MHNKYSLVCNPWCHLLLFRLHPRPQLPCKDTSGSRDYAELLRSRLKEYLLTLKVQVGDKHHWHRQGDHSNIVCIELAST